VLRDPQFRRLSEQTMHLCSGLTPHNTHRSFDRKHLTSRSGLRETWCTAESRVLTSAPLAGSRATSEVDSSHLLLLQATTDVREALLLAWVQPVEPQQLDTEQFQNYRRSNAQAQTGLISVPSCQTGKRSRIQYQNYWVVMW
jgi:hypothetical protein